MKHHLSIPAILLGVIFLLGTEYAAYATQTDNHGLHAVPAPGKITIDGRLDDWDLSGQTLMCYDIETLKDVYSANVAMMYDAANLYVSLHWKASRPMSNSHDPHYQASRGWAGDCVQLRIKTDRIAHVSAWYYAARKEPTIQIEYGKSASDAFGAGTVSLYQTAGWKLTEGAEMGFLQDPDGKGYVQEIKLPWKLITSTKKYNPGDQFNCGVETLWGSVDWPVMRYADNLMPGKSSREFFFTSVDSWGPVTLEPKGMLHLPTPDYITRALHPETETPGAAALSYNLAKAGRVTLVIEDENGKRIRNLIPALPRSAGKNIAYWDGLDDNGQAAPPGKYRFRGMVHDSIHLNWALSFANPGHPAWSTPDGRGAFYADHTNPHAVAAAGNYVCLACPMGEGGNPLICCDLNGQRLWGQANRQSFAGGIQSVAADGKTLWVAAEDIHSYIYRTDMATGQYSPWNHEAVDEHGTKYRVLDFPVSDLPGSGAESHPALNLTSIAYRSGTLAVCLARENSIKLLDSDTGALQRVISVEKPQSVVLDSDGSVIALSEGRLLRFSQDGSHRSFSEELFSAGVGLAIDGQRNVYLSVRGTDQNVKVFSPEGKLVHEIGKRGGRPLHGVYLPEGMLNPAGIAVDSHNHLWVTEENDNPKRTSVWDMDGKLVKDLAGTNHYSAAGSIDPFDSSYGYSDDTVYKLDWKQGLYQPIYSMHASSSPDAIFAPHVHNITSSIIQHNADRLFYSPDEFGSAVSCTIGHDGGYRPAARVGTVQNYEELNHNQYASGELRARYAHPVFKGHIGECYSWADKNGDGLVQPEEITFSKINHDGNSIKLQSFGWGTLPGPDGTITYISLETQSLVQFPISGYTESGAPIYDISHPRFLPVDLKVLGEGNGEGMIRGGTDGIVYLNQDPIIAVDRNGHVLFTYPSHFTSVHGSHDAASAKPGYIIGPSSILGTANVGGEAGEVFDMNGNLGEHFLFTSDGLFVQSLFKDVRGGFETPEQAVPGISFDANTGGGESFGGNFMRSPDGKVYLTIGGSDATVLEVTGLDTIKRLPAVNLIYTTAQYDTALKQARLKSQKSTEPKVYTITRVPSPPAMEGKESDWPELRDDTKQLIEIQDSPSQRFARVQAHYDSDNLYLAYRVFAHSNHMRNSGQDERLLFKTGDAVDIMFAPDNAGSNAGGARLLMTYRGDKPAAILYEKTVSGTPAGSRVPFASPARVLYFDRVQSVKSVQLAAGQIDGGYLVEAKIPWALLGIKAVPGLKLRADIGVLSADNGGTFTVSRQYWSNKATGLVNDIPGEAELTPSLWGTIELK